ncbi:MAG: hypothetical protein HC934_05195, partial [Acaryochloridaceae cyanobacterium SU_2_1]|nr:hypothetical protein [Acaryochloridaceae cyanobacterium SU_2_1]
IRRAQAIDSDKYGNPEFLAFIRLKQAFIKGLPGYENLDRYLQLLHAGIQAKSTFISLERIEFKFCSSKQSEFYDYIETLFQSNIEQAEFRAKAEEKFLDIYPYLRTAEGKTVLQQYHESLDRLAKHQFAFRLLRSFKRKKLKNYSIFNTIAKIISTLSRSDIHNLSVLNTEVISHYETFQQLGAILGMPDQFCNPKTFGRMLQYIALEEKYKNAYPKFQELVVLLQEWQQHFLVIKNIRQEYASKIYKPEKAFKTAVLGVDIYQKYQPYLSSTRNLREALSPPSSFADKKYLLAL